MEKRVFLKSVGYMFRGQLGYARQAVGESVMCAVVRSVARKVDGAHPGLTLWWKECREGHEVYRASWFNEKSEIFEEAEVVLA